jgi:serine/threonine protein kinase
MKEAEIMVHLSHPNIIQLKQIIIEENVLEMYLEYAEGKQLSLLLIKFIISNSKLSMKSFKFDFFALLL